MRKCLFRLTVLEVSAHNWLAHLFGGCSEAIHHGGLKEVVYLSHSSQEAER
jgi:hypothetical protein